MPESKRRKPKKKRRPSPAIHGSARATQSPSMGGSDFPGPPADFRAMERATASIVPGRSGKRGRELDLQDAQDLIYDAWESPDPQERVKLAYDALARSPDCADAYVIFAEEIPGTLEEKRDMYAAGVEAGEQALGARPFKEDVGHFWGLLQTRPYMRARAGLAACLWELGEREEAVTHYRDLLRLNPNDNQGVRYTLLGCLLTLGRDDEAGELLDSPEYADDGTAMWPYARALLTYRREGPSERAGALLQEALEVNPHIPAYLVGRKRVPKQLPDLIGFGDASEAIAYAADYLEAWRSTPGTVEWLGSAT